MCIVTNLHSGTLYMRKYKFPWNFLLLANVTFVNVTMSNCFFIDTLLKIRFSPEAKLKLAPHPNIVLVSKIAVEVFMKSLLP